MKVPVLSRSIVAFKTTLVLQMHVARFLPHVFNRKNASLENANLEKTDLAGADLEGYVRVCFVAVFLNSCAKLLLNLS
jgi:hypothetical protein